MLTEDYVSYEVAKLLKEKGFPMGEHLFMYVNKDGKLMTDNHACLNMTNEEYRTFFDDYIPTVTQSLAMKWLREIHDISIELLTMHRNCWGYYVCKILDNTNEGLHDKNYFNTYEEAIEAALKYCLTKLI